MKFDENLWNSRGIQSVLAHAAAGKSADEVRLRLVSTCAKAFLAMTSFIAGLVALAVVAVESYAPKVGAWGAVARFALVLWVLVCHSVWGRCVDFLTTFREQSFKHAYKLWRDKQCITRGAG